MRAEGDLDFRGTLGVERTPRSASATSDSPSRSTPTSRRSSIDTLLKLTERYCVVLQTLRHPPAITAQAEKRTG